MNPTTTEMVTTAAMGALVLGPIIIHVLRNSGKKSPALKNTLRIPQPGASLRMCVCGHPEKNHPSGGCCSGNSWIGGMAKIVPCDCSTFRPERLKSRRPEEVLPSDDAVLEISLAPREEFLEESPLVEEVPAVSAARGETPKREGEPSLLEFYGLREQPFGVTPDPAYLYLGPGHRDALAALSHGIKSDRGFMALIARPGMGKTTLMYQLLEDLRDSARSVFLFQTQCNSREFFRHLLSELGIDSTGMDLVSMHDKLNHLLFQEMLDGKRFVLIVDEAQNLDDSVLETIRLLSDFETPHAKLLEIILVGQPQLAVKLARPGLAQLRQRIAILTQLEPLSPSETSRYIEHRLEVAGYAGDPLFSPDALAMITARGRGTPRIINNLCFNALSLGYAQGRRTINSDIVREVVAKLDVESIAEESFLRPARPAEAPAPAAAPAPVPQLSYKPVGQSSRRRWTSRVGVISLALVASLLLLPSLRKLDPAALRAAVHAAIQKAAPRAWSVGAASAEPGSSGGEFTMQPGSSVPATGVPLTVTVVAGPQQSLKDISFHYLGRGDQKLLEEIGALNPQLGDPNQIEPGQYIRLPLTPAPPKDDLGNPGAGLDARTSSGN